MYSVYLLLFILIIRTDGFTLDDEECNYVFKQKCYRDVNNYDLVTYDSSVVNYCSEKDVPTKFNFTKIPADNEKGELIDRLKIEFGALKTECGYGVTLLVEPSIKSERECLQYKFENAKNANIHTIEKSLCILTNSSNHVRYNDNSTISLCKNNILLEFYYIFTGCYALQFHLGGQNDIIRGHEFLNTTYTRMEVAKPEFSCKYDLYPTLDERHEMTNFTLETSLSADTRLFTMEIIPDHDKTSLCFLSALPNHKWIVDLENKTQENANCSINKVRENGEYIKTVECNFQEQFPTTTTGYCVMMTIIDERCFDNTVWKPPVQDNITCTWLKRCTRTFEASRIETPAQSGQREPYTGSYLLLPIIAIILVVLAIIGALYFIHYLRLRNEVNLYVNPQQDDFANPTCLKPTDFDIVETNDSKKDIDCVHLAYDDIVLLYTKSSAPFMAMMKDFREVLTKMCSCTVHDWHDGAEWNDVARVGAVLWFTRLLNNGCRVIWIDTPATRSVVISNSRESDTNLNKLSKYYEIGDFRDVAFPVVLELAKRNTKDLVIQYRKHFIVRFEGLESSENVNDPFLDLSPHARYLMPQHFVQLCTHLSGIVSPTSSIYELEMEKDRLHQRLKFMKMESIM